MHLSKSGVPLSVACQYNVIDIPSRKFIWPSSFGVIMTINNSHDGIIGLLLLVFSSILSNGNAQPGTHAVGKYFA